MWILNHTPIRLLYLFVLLSSTSTLSMKSISIPQTDAFVSRSVNEHSFSTFFSFLTVRFYGSNTHSRLLYHQSRVSNSNNLNKDKNRKLECTRILELKWISRVFNFFPIIFMKRSLSFENFLKDRKLPNFIIPDYVPSWRGHHSPTFLSQITALIDLSPSIKYSMLVRRKETLLLE